MIRDSKKTLYLQDLLGDEEAFRLVSQHHPLFEDRAKDDNANRSQILEFVAFNKPLAPLRCVSTQQSKRMFINVEDRHDCNGHRS